MSADYELCGDRHYPTVEVWPESDGGVTLIQDEPVSDDFGQLVPDVEPVRQIVSMNGEQFRRLLVIALESIL